MKFSRSVSHLVDVLDNKDRHINRDRHINVDCEVFIDDVLKSIFSELLNSPPFKDTIKQLQEELRSIEDADKLCTSFSDWLSSTQRSFAELTDRSEPLDRVAIERKMKKLEVFAHFSSSIFLFTCVMRRFKTPRNCSAPQIFHCGFWIQHLIYIFLQVTLNQH